jgi:hypothetical protein
LGPRRTLAVTAVLALAVLTVTTGVAVARDGGPGHGGKHDRPPTAAADPGAGTGWQHRSDSPREQGGVPSVGAGPAAHTGPPSRAGAASAISPATVSDDTFGSVTTSGVGNLPASVGAPAAAASGPAPDAAAAAPVSGGVTDAFVVAGGTTDAPSGAVPVPDVAPVATPAASAVTGLVGLGALPALGPVGAVTDRVPDASSATRALLDAGTGRSLGVIGTLLAAIVLFLAVHRRADKGDRKLAATRSGPEVARFR